MRTCGIGNNGGEVWKWFHMTDCKGGPRCNTIPSALETGSQTIDNKIRMPDEVTVEGWVNEKDYTSLKNLDEMIDNNSIDKLMSIVSRDAIYKDMILISMDTQSMSDNWEYIKAYLKFQEVFFDDSDPNGDNSTTR